MKVDDNKDMLVSKYVMPFSAKNYYNKKYREKMNLIPGTYEVHMEAIIETENGANTFYRSFGTGSFTIKGIE